MTKDKITRMPVWTKWVIAAGVGAGAATGGQKLATDSSVHLFVEGKEPEAHDGWVCAPEGGLIGAPVVCRPVAEVTTATGIDNPAHLASPVEGGDTSTHEGVRP